MKRIIKKLTYLFLLVVIPIVIISTIVGLFLSGEIFNNSIGHCVDLVLVISTWIIVVLEYFSRLKTKGKYDDSNFKVVDCMTIILTIITICYSIIQICAPPIVFNQILKLIIWSTSIIIYTILARPTKARVLTLCLVATFVTVLYVCPPTYQDFYEKEISNIIENEKQFKYERHYNAENSENSGIWYEQRNYQGQENAFQKLLEDEYFTNNFGDSLRKNILTYERFKNTLEKSNNHIRPAISVSYVNGNYKTPVDFGEDIVLKVNGSSVDGTITKFNVDRVMLNGVTFDYEIIGGDECIEILFDNINGFSGIKTITFLDGYIEDQNGNLSSEISLSFKYYGYDLIIILLLVILVLVFSLTTYIKYRKFLTCKEHVS